MRHYLRNPLPMERQKLPSLPRSLLRMFATIVVQKDIGRGIVRYSWRI